MSIEKKNDARLDVRVPSELRERFLAWVVANPDVKNKTDGLIQAIEKIMGNDDPDCGFLTDQERQILDDHRRSMNPIPMRRKIIADLILSLKKD